MGERKNAQMQPNPSLTTVAKKGKKRWKKEGKAHNKKELMKRKQRLGGKKRRNTKEDET